MDPRDAADWVTLLTARAARDSETTAYTFLDSRGREADAWSFPRLHLEASRVCRALTEVGAEGQPVLLVLPSGLDYIAAFFGCLYAGAIAVPVLPPRPNRSAARLESIAKDCGAAHVVTTARLTPRMRNALDFAITLIDVDACPAEGLEPEARPAPEDIAFLQYTSGSTAAPKGVRVSHAHLLANQRMMAEAFDTGGDFSVVGWLPLHHDMGLIGTVLQPLFQGAPCALMAPETFLMRPLRWLEAIDRYRATTSGAPNFAYELCVERIDGPARAQLDLSSWRVAFNGSEPIRQSSLRRFAEAFAGSGFSERAFVPCYGLAEATLLVTAAPVDEVPRVDGAGRIDCGRPPPGTEIRIVDATSRTELPRGAEGEIWVRGPSVAGGYQGDPEKSREVFDAHLANTEGSDSFLRTGDLGYLGPEGTLTVTGRIKDLIILAGKNHHPQDIEHAIEAADPHVVKGGAAAFALRSWPEEQVGAVVELHRHAPDAAASEVRIRQHVLESTGIALSEILVVRQGALLRTTSGKVRRGACRDALLRGDLREGAWRKR